MFVQMVILRGKTKGRMAGKTEFKMVWFSPNAEFYGAQFYFLHAIINIFNNEGGKPGFIWGKTAKM